MTYAIAIRTIIQIAAGLGMSKVLDMFGRKTVPQYYPQEEVIPKSVTRLLWLGGVFAMAMLLVKFFGKQLKINALK